MVKRNAVANMIGKSVSALLSFVFVPFYLRYLGVEAYGLIGLYVLLQAVFMVADLGLSGAFTREVARLSAADDDGAVGELRDLCRSFEIIFAVIGVIAAALVIALAQPIAAHWVKPDSLPVAVVAATLVYIGITIGLRFPFFIQQGGMQGLQRQLPLNVLLVGTALLQGLGAVAVLAWVDASIEAYFIWQIIVALVQITAGHLLLWRLLPPGERPAFRPRMVVPLWRFATGMAGITLSGILLMQADKAILSERLSLAEFGYYSLATVVAGIPGIVSYSLFNAVYPRLVQLVAAGEEELRRFYHLACQAMAVLLIPLGLVISMYAAEVIRLWTGNTVTAAHTAPLAAVLVCGSVLMGLMMVPYALQLAYGWTAIGLRFNIAALMVLVPTLVWAVDRYGAPGACYSWVGLYLGQIVIIISWMHRRLLVGEQWRWYWRDTLLPLLPPLALVLVVRLFVAVPTSPVATMALLVLLGGAALTAALLGAPELRAVALTHLTAWRVNR